MNCLKTYQAVGAVRDNGQAEMLISVDELLARYEKRKLYWESNYGERVDIYFTNYLRNSCIKDVYVKSANLLDHFSNLFLDLPILRFFILQSCRPE